MKRKNNIKTTSLMAFILCFLLCIESIFGYNLAANAQTLSSNQVTESSNESTNAFTNNSNDINSSTSDINTSNDASTNKTVSVESVDKSLDESVDKSLDENIDKNIETDSNTLKLTSSTFVDKKLSAYLFETYDTNKDEILSEEEITSITKLDISNMGIVSLGGLESFTNLEELDCSSNQLTTLNLMPYAKLSTLDCSYNQLINLDISKNLSLENISCIGNARALQLNEDNSFDLSALKDFDIKQTNNWSFEYATKDNLLSFPNFTSPLIVTYTTEYIETNWLYEPILFSFVVYKDDLKEMVIDETSIPDATLRQLLLFNFDKNEDFVLDEEELMQITSLDISSYDIKDLTGLESLPTLAYINYSREQSLTLNLNILSNLVKQYCDNEPVTIDTDLNEQISDETNDETTDTNSDMEIPLDSNTQNQESNGNTDIPENTPTQENNSIPIDVSKNIASKTAYKITYELDGGINPDNAVTTYYAGDTVTLPSPTKKGCQFDGWYLNNDNTNLITTLSNMENDVTVHAKWTNLSVTSKPDIKKLKLSGKGKLSITYKAIDNIKGYEVLCATSKNFKNNLRTTTTSKTSITVKNLIKNKTYYVKVRAYIIDSTGEKVYGPYSSIKKIKTKTGVEETKATSTAAKISSAKLTNSDTITVKAKSSKIIKSKDSYYYLFSVPSTQKNLKKLKPIDKVEKSTSVTFKTNLDKYGTNNLLHSKFVVAVKEKSGYKIVSPFHYITNPEAAANYTYAFPTTATKKGLQDFSSSLGVNHTILNLEVNDLIATKSEYASSSTDKYTYKGKTYYFRRDVANQYAYTAREYERKGTVVYAILLLSWSSKTNLIAPGARTEGFPYYAWNMKDQNVKEQLEATITYFAEYCCKVSKTGPGIAGWIVGNEVDNFDTWNYAGTSNIDTYTKIYADTFRLVYNATKSVYSNARVYVSLDHMWAMSNEGSFGSKAFLEKFNSILQAEGNIDWHIAFHPYPVPLTETAFWKNDFISNNANSPIINMKNLSVLTNYVKKTYGKNKRVILSEIGFTSQRVGEKTQAAAIAYAYYVAEFNPMVDAFIMRSLEDAQIEVEQGLSFGIKGKYAYDVYKYMDTPKSEQYTKFALKIIKAKSWKSIVPNYKASKFKSMPNR